MTLINDMIKKISNKSNHMLKTKKLMMILLVLLLITPVSNISAARPSSPPIASWNYRALGDSIATGFLATKGYVSRYRDYITIDIPISVKLTNSGVKGQTSGELLNKLRTNALLRKGVAGSQVVTWNTGGNDLNNAHTNYKNGNCGGTDNQDCLRTTVAQLKSNWDGIITEILSLRSPSNTIIRTMDIYNPYVSSDTVADFLVFKPYLDEVNSYIVSTSEASGILVAKVYLTFNGVNGDEDPITKGYLATDGFHPNDAGHKVIADLLRALGYTL
ncbi:MAG: GDSL-type esterase/lipase family protein [bacterium]|nr:GDSL-type esterase/lipase family protein [bacterium]